MVLLSIQILLLPPKDDSFLVPEYGSYECRKTVDWRRWASTNHVQIVAVPCCSRDCCEGDGLPWLHPLSAPLSKPLETCPLHWATPADANYCIGNPCLFDACPVPDKNGWHAPLTRNSQRIRYGHPGTAAIELVFVTRFTEDCGDKTLINLAPLVTIDSYAKWEQNCTMK